MNNWIEKTDILNYRYVADGVKNEQLLDQCIKEAMFFDIQKILTQPLFYEISSEFDSNNLSDLNKKLLDGGSYVYGDYTYSFQGVKACLAYYAFSRYTLRDGFKFTAAGPVIKNDEMSDPVTDATRSRLANDDAALAEALKLEIIDYLNRKASDYPLWRCKTKRRSMKFKSIGD